MTIHEILKTVYVFEGKNSAILKKQTDGSLKITSSDITYDKLIRFLQSQKYEVAS